MDTLGTKTLQALPVDSTSGVEGPPVSPPPAVDTSRAIVAEIVGHEPALPATLQQYMRPCTPQEDRAAELYVATGNRTAAWREAFGHVDEKPCGRHWMAASDLFARPWVQARVRELRRAWAIDYAMTADDIMAHDVAIVNAAQYADRLSQVVHYCCRHCHGQGFKYQWRDEQEFAIALAQAIDDNAALALDHKRTKPLPTDEGGYGYTRELDPHPACPHCEGCGIERMVIADTRNLGPAAPLFLGIDPTAAGPKVVRADVDKAKERILRRLGAFGDDAASVARGAAAGAAAGASASAIAGAVAAAKAANSLTVDQCQRLYLQVING